MKATQIGRGTASLGRGKWSIARGLEECPDITDEHFDLDRFEEVDMR